MVKHIKRERESCKILMANSVPDEPLIRTRVQYPFAVIGVGFVGPFCMKEKEGDRKANTILF